jgi:hypothetical protein
MILTEEKPGIDLDDLSANNLIRLCVGAVAEHESITDRAEIAAMVVDLREQGGPTFRGDGVEIELLGWEYFLVDTDLAEAMARDAIEEFAGDQARELEHTMHACGINTVYVSFDYDMYIRDAMMNWECWVGSYDDVVNEYFPQTTQNGKVENFGCFSIWRVS